MNLLTKFKAWQLFIIIHGFIVFSFIILLFTNSYSFVKNISYISFICGIIVWIYWLYSIGMFLYNKNREKTFLLNKTLFSIFIIYIIIIIVINLFTLIEINDYLLIDLSRNLLKNNNSTIQIINLFALIYITSFISINLNNFKEYNLINYFTAVP